MSIYRTTNPAEFDDIDGIVIAEQNPPPSISGVGTGMAIFVGQFARGPLDMTEIAGAGEQLEIFGANSQLKNKRFSRLRIIRAAAAAAAKATKAFQSSTTDRITFTAKYVGAYGNSITVTIESGTASGKKYTIHDGNSDAVLPDEVYDNIEIASITASTFADSKLVDVTVNSTAAEPSNASATALAGGSDGSIADTDYQTAIAKAEVERAGNVIFLDAYNTTRNGYVKSHVDTMKDKIGIICGAEGDSVSTAVSAVATLRSDRLIYGYPWVQTVIDGAVVFQPPASWIASILSQTSPHIDPAYAANASLWSGVTGLKANLTRAQFIQLNEAGISGIEFDSDIGFKLKNGVTTNIAEVEKRPVLRRRMADYYQDSVAYFLKQFQNAPNTRANRDLIKGAILAWDRTQEREGVLPSDDEVQDGTAKLVDTESGNTDTTIGQGYMIILLKRRIYSSMRFIVLKAQIGTTVVVTEVA